MELSEIIIIVSVTRSSQWSCCVDLGQAHGMRLLPCYICCLCAPYSPHVHTHDAHGISEQDEAGMHCSLSDHRNDNPHRVISSVLICLACPRSPAGASEQHWQLYWVDDWHCSVHTDDAEYGFVPCWVSGHSRFLMLGFDIFQQRHELCNGVEMRLCLQYLLKTLFVGT
jgi:hypothetical protein